MGVQKGDRVTIYLTMIPELAYIMLACARIGAVHSIIFGGFSPEALADRINDCESNPCGLHGQFICVETQIVFGCTAC